MKTWMKLLVCGVLSFAFLFMTAGYATLTDTLQITGTVNVDRVVFYTVTYMANNVVYAVDEITDNSVEYTIRKDGPANGSAPFKCWVNASANEMVSIPAGNTNNYTLSATWKNIYVIIFADVDGTILYQESFVEGTTSLSPEGQQIVATKLGELNAVAALQDMSVVWSDYNMAAGGDITVRPVYSYNGCLDLIPVYEQPDDGIVDYYQIDGYKNDDGVDVVKIPGEYGGKKITSINENAFSSYPDLHCVTIPVNVTYIGNFAFAKNWGFLAPGETQTLYYEGSYQQWLDYMTYAQNAFNGLSENTRIFFLNGGDKVDPSQGYLQVEKGGSIFSPRGTLTHKTNINVSLINEMYTQICNCGKVDHSQTNQSGDNRRPDYIYWGNTDGTGQITLALNPDVTEPNGIVLNWNGIDDTFMDSWYPVDEQSPVPGNSYEIAFEPAQGCVMAETVRVLIDDVEYVVQTNGYVPEGDVVPAYDPERNILMIPAELLTAETKTVAIVAFAVSAESGETTGSGEELEQ